LNHSWHTHEVPRQGYGGAWGINKGSICPSGK
ncbi:uncharacterized protein METZ01_LOCUS511167, partial [marine metagenome]